LAHDSVGFQHLITIRHKPLECFLACEALSSLSSEIVQAAASHVFVHLLFKCCIPLLLRLQILLLF
jgi:hypothetical protein